MACGSFPSQARSSGVPACNPAGRPVMSVPKRIRGDALELFAVGWRSPDPFEILTYNGRRVPGVHARFPMPSLDTLICVGGAGGIGSACSRLFASRGNWPSSHCSASRLPLQRSATDHADERAGWRVCVLDTAESLGAALAEELGPCAFFHAIDVGSEISVVAAFSAALSFSEGRLDALVVMSAKFLYGEVHTINAEQWADVCRINLAGPAL